MTWFGTKQAGERAKRSRHSAARRAREKEAGPGITPEERARVYARVYCAICKLPTTASDRTIDHEVPLAKGGTHDERNLRLCHRSCNSSKGARTAPRKKGLRRTAWKPKSKPKLEGDPPPGCF